MEQLTIPEFRGWGKTPRLFQTPHQARNGEPVLTITEKIDGTNGCVLVTVDGNVFAQSRTRFVSRTDDNHGFGAWVEDHQHELAQLLGPGYHYGEWYGKKINRSYGLEDRRFALFNVERWAKFANDNREIGDFGLEVVPTLEVLTEFESQFIREAMESLRARGSAVNGWKDPEGIVVRHHASGHLYKVTYSAK